MTHDPNDLRDREPSLGADAEADGNTISPLPGEPGIPNVAARQRIAMSKKGLLAVVLLIGSLVAVAAFTIQRFSASGKKADEAESKLVQRQAHGRHVRAAQAGDAAGADRQCRSGHRAAHPGPDAHGRRTGRAHRRAAHRIGCTRIGWPEGGPTRGCPRPAGHHPAGGTPAARVPPPEGRMPRHRRPRARPAPEPADPNDPIAATSRNLQGYQRQLQGLLDNLTKTAALATGQATGQMPSGALLGGPPIGRHPHPSVAPAAGGGLFGGQLQGSATPKVAASMLGNRSLTLPKGTAFTCALKTKVISATSGLVGCQVQRNVFSDDGRVLLIERGSHLDGEYRIASVRPGTVRIPVLWTRIRTPLGVTVDIDSPGTGQLGESGIDGYVDNRWGERIGAAMLLSLIDDSVKLVIQNQASDRQADTIVLPSTTANTSKLAEKVLDSTINIPPLIYQNQGGIVGIYVARDVDFSSVYELKPTAGAPPREGTP